MSQSPCLEIYIVKPLYASLIKLTVVMRLKPYFHIANDLLINKIGQL